jgi:hypothetical protein
MATLSEATEANLAGYTPLPTPVPAAVVPVGGSGELSPVLNTMIRCPLPLYSSATPDSLRQFYTGGVVPQVRFLSPPLSNTLGSGTTTENATVSSVNRGGVAPTTPTTNGVQQAIETTLLSPGNRFTSSIKMSDSFQVLNVTSNTACRVELYGSAQAQTFDTARALDVPPPAGTTQNIIFDVVLDTSPFAWTFQNRTGANADTPMSELAYLTVTNLGDASSSIMVTISYVALGS